MTPEVGTLVQFKRHGGVRSAVVAEVLYVRGEPLCDKEPVVLLRPLFSKKNPLAPYSAYEQRRTRLVNLKAVKEYTQ